MELFLLTIFVSVFQLAFDMLHTCADLFTYQAVAVSTVAVSTITLNQICFQNSMEETNYEI